MNLFARNPWGWSTFAFWVIWLWFVLNCDRSYLNSFSDETCTGIADGLFFALPWLVTMAVYIGAHIAGRRSNAAFWKGYYVGRESEKQQLPYSQIPDDAEEVDWEHRLPKHKGIDNG